MKLIKTLTFLTLLLMSTPAMAAQSPQSLATDQRIREVMYSPDEVYEIATTFGFQTTIELSPHETIQEVSVGDAVAWRVTPSANRVYVKAWLQEKTMTNMSVETDRRTYFFNLTSRPVNHPRSMTYLVRFKYPDTGIVFTNATKPKPTSELNFNYKLKKTKKSGLIRAFDDGEFTYLQFQDLSELPAIFAKGKDGKEALVNYRIEGPYVVVERVLSQLVLRRGKGKSRLINQGRVQS